MLKNYFRTAFRQLMRNKVFSLINIIGLSTGLAAIIALSLLVYQYASADSNQYDINSMYYLKTHAANGNEYAQTPYKLLPEIIKRCPQVEAATHIQTWNYPWIKAGDKEFQEKTEFVDTGYFRVFVLPLKYGNSNTALQRKFSVVFSEEIAEKFFGNRNPLGLTVSADDSIQLTVTGVLQHVPANSSIHPNVLMSTALLESNPDFKTGADWYNTFASNYLRLRKNADPKKLDAGIAQIVLQNYSQDQKKNRVISVPFKKIHEDSSALIGVLIKGAGGAGIFILIIILVNLINLNTAGMYTRTREVAIKQMMGSSRKSIVMQFCIENAIIVFASLVLAWLLFSIIILPNIKTLINDSMGGLETDVARNYPLIPLFSAIGIMFTILAASIPALKLTAVKVTDAVKGKISSSNLNSGAMRNLFITIQFIMAITLIGITIILNRQINFMKSSALGFEKDQIAVVPLGLAFRDQPTANARFGTIVQQLKSNPHVKSVSVNSVVPTAYWDNFNTYVDPITNKEVMLRQEPADAGFLSTFRIPLLQGKAFDDEVAASLKNAVYVNRSAMNLFGWKDAVGKQIRARGEEGETYTVAGVMEDFHYRDLSGSIEPLVQSYSGKPALDGGYLSVRTSAGYLKPVMEELRKQFRSMPSKREFSYELMSDKVEGQYALLDGILKATNLIAMLTIIIASLGMFGLIALFSKMRVKEIGIRKVLGASLSGIVRLLSKDFLILVGIAILIATPISWYVMHTWLLDFAYRIQISWWMFAFASLIALAIAFGTISFQAIKAGSVNPVKSLRSE